jgi:hypothetical protein
MPEEVFMTNQPQPQSTNDQPQRARSFNPNEHVIQLKSKDGLKDYLPVQWRIVWFRGVCPQGTIDTEELECDLDREVEAEVYVWNAEKRRSEKVIKKAKGYARYRTVVTDGKGGRASGTKSESAVNFSDYVEKAETGSVGRALANLGYGTQFTGEEFNEEHRIVDSPVERSTAAPVESNGNVGGERKPIVAVRVSSGSTTSANSTDTMPITDQQLSSIRKLSQHLGKAEPEQVESTSYGRAKELIAQLSQEYRQSRSRAS